MEMQRKAMKSNEGHDPYHGGGPLAPKLTFKLTLQSALKIVEIIEILWENHQFHMNAFKTIEKNI